MWSRQVVTRPEPKQSWKRQLRNSEVTSARLEEPLEGQGGGTGVGTASSTGVSTWRGPTRGIAKRSGRGTCWARLGQGECGLSGEVTEFKSQPMLCLVSPQELPLLGGVLDDQAGPAARIRGVAGHRPHTPREERRWVAMAPSLIGQEAAAQRALTQNPSAGQSRLTF